MFISLRNLMTAEATHQVFLPTACLFCHQTSNLWITTSHVLLQSFIGTRVRVFVSISLPSPTSIKYGKNSVITYSYCSPLLEVELKPCSVMLPTVRSYPIPYLLRSKDLELHLNSHHVSGTTPIRTFTKNRNSDTHQVLTAVASSTCM